VRHLDEDQVRQLGVGRQRAGRDLKEAIWRAYRHVLILDRDNELREIDLGQVHSSMAGSLAELIVNRLRQEDEITETVGPHKLVRYWPPALTAWSTKAARDAFFSSPLLPRLLDPGAIRRTIVDGVAQKVLAYAGPLVDGRHTPLHFGVTLSEADIEISDEMFLLTAEEARKHVEPPRLERLVVQPAAARLRPGDQMRFTVEGLDQHGRPFAVGGTNWAASAGTIGADGTYTAPEAPGEWTVATQVGDVKAHARVDVIGAATVAPDDGGPRVREPGRTAGVGWQGELAPQKWMNFYTKVLSRFATTPGLKLQVRFEVPAEGVTDSKLDETRTALRELGLNEELQQR
jgi:hypothetical protein